MSDHECDAGHFDRTICPEPCGMMHSFCSTCGARADICAHEGMSRTEDVGLTETERVTLRHVALIAHGCGHDGMDAGLAQQRVIAAVERIVADRVREAEQCGAVRALREVEQAALAKDAEANSWDERVYPNRVTRLRGEASIIRAALGDPQ